MWNGTLEKTLTTSSSAFSTHTEPFRAHYFAIKDISERLITSAPASSHWVASHCSLATGKSILSVA